MRRYLETRGVVGGHVRTHQRVGFASLDGTRLAASYFLHPSPDAPAVVLLHGFGAHRRKPAYARLADALADSATVLAVDLRGHGESGGECTMGTDEALDVIAGVDWLRRRGHDWVSLLGVSMGATAVLHALSRGVDADAVVVVSSPGYLRARPGTVAMQRLHRAWRSPLARAGLRRGLGIRLVSPQRWTPPPHPAVAARGVSVPMLVVHGRDDHFFGIEDAEAIAAAAAPVSTLWVEPVGFGHAEDGIDDDFCRRAAAAIVQVRAQGWFPERDDVARAGVDGE